MSITEGINQTDHLQLWQLGCASSYWPLPPGVAHFSRRTWRSKRPSRARRLAALAHFSLGSLRGREGRQRARPATASRGGAVSGRGVRAAERPRSPAASLLLSTGSPHNGRFTTLVPTGSGIPGNPFQPREPPERSAAAATRAGTAYIARRPALRAGPPEAQHGLLPAVRES